MDAVNKTDKAFKILFNITENIAIKMASVDNSVKHMFELKEDTTKAIETISAISEETAALTEISQVQRNK